MLRKARFESQYSQLDKALAFVDGAWVRAFKCLWLWMALVQAAFPASAFADAIGPPPKLCAPWKVPVSDHEGSRCESRPPDNCPSGWTGRLGNKCVLSRCDGGSTCPKGTVCSEQSACLHKGELMSRHGPTGIFQDWPVGICGAGATCDAPDRCAPWKICVEPGTSATPYVPKPSDPNDSGPPRKAGGGCSLGGSGGEVPLSLGMLALGLGFLVLRRRS